MHDGTEQNHGDYTSDGEAISSNEDYSSRAGINDAFPAVLGDDPVEVLGNDGFRLFLGGICHKVSA